MTVICIATEDRVSEAVVEKLLTLSQHEFRIDQRFGKNGFGYLKKRFPVFNNIARHTSAVFMLTDLDSRPCVVELIEEWSGGFDIESQFLFRVAVREVEAWLLADDVSFSEFFHVSRKIIPREPEILVDPKRELLRIVGRSSLRRIRDEVLPEIGTKAKVGLGYNDVLSTYVREQWDPCRASYKAQSLARAIVRVEALAQERICPNVG